MNEQDPGVKVVRGCLTEESKSVLGAFFCDPLQVKLQDK